jgi:DNA-binding NarL/FixJ family response regulator
MNKNTTVIVAATTRIPSIKLSPRESAVLQMMTDGDPMKEIGRILHISVKTVATHRRNLMRKLGIDDLANLVKYAIREGITSAEPRRARRRGSENIAAPEIVEPGN